MKKLLTLAAILALAAPAAMAAPKDASPDGIGVYFDLSGTSNCEMSPAPYTPLTAYLLLTNPSRPSVGGWEAALLINPTSFPTGITLDPGFLSIVPLVPPYLQVGLPVARAGNPILLLTISTFYMGGTIEFGLGPCVPSSFGGLSPGYADGADTEILVPLTVSGHVPWTLPVYTGGDPVTAPPNSFECAWFNSATDCPEVDAAEPSSWGSVKALYR